MKLSGLGKLLRVFVGESDRFHGDLIYDVIVLKAKELGLAGTTVLRGIEGFGAGTRIHSAKLVRLSENLPVVIEIVDIESRIFLMQETIDKLFEESGCGGLVTLEDIEIIKYAPAKI